MCLFCPCSWKIYSWSIECWVISLVPPHGRSTQLPVSMGAVKRYLMALMFLHWTLFFLSVKIFYLSLLFQRFIIICLNIYKFLFISLAWYLLGFWNYNNAFINSGKLLAIISSSITATQSFHFFQNTNEFHYAFSVSLQVSYSLFHC